MKAPTVDESRRLAVVYWTQLIGMPDEAGRPAAHVIPQVSRSIVVTPVNEGELLVDYRVFDERVLDNRIPLSKCCDEDGELLTLSRSLVTDEAPPGFRLPAWDAWAYITHTDFASAWRV